MPPKFTYLETEERQRVIDSALALLEKIGVQVTDRQARELLLDAGAEIRELRACIPADLVQSALDSAPDKIVIFDRFGQQKMDLSGQNYYFGAHIDAPDILDPCTGRRRPCLEKDVRKNAALIESLENICFITASGLIADCSADLADRLAFANCLEVSTKPVLVMPVTLSSLKQMRAMAVIAAGGDIRFRQQPNLIVYAEPVSPLAHPDESLQKLCYCAEYEIPVAYVPYAARGATAPMSQAGILAQLTAESLSALVIHQLYRPGAPFIFGGMASIMDMRTTIFSYGAPEFQVGNTLMVEIARHLKLPNFGTAGTSDAQTFDGQAILEASTSSMLAAMSGAHLVHDVGLIGSATLIAPAMITATNEIASMMKKITAKVPVDPESLSLDRFAPVNDKGEFMTDPYTLAHFREVWYPDFLYRGGAKRWEISQQETFQQRINQFTCERWQQPAEDTLSAERSLRIRQLIG